MSASASWKKVIVSGSIAELNNLSVDNNVNITGSLNVGSNQSISTTAALLTGSFTGSFAGDGAGLINIPAAGIVGLELYRIASGSATASISPNNGLEINVSTTITGSLIVSGSTGNSFDINADTFIFTGSLSTSGSVAFVLTQASSSYVVGYNPATGLLTYESTGSGAVTASYAISASHADNADNAISASQAQNAVSASYATSASQADNATSASYATSASQADNATSASQATSASYATSASQADNATSASYATSASQADNATSASYATSASQADNATSASYADAVTGSSNLSSGSVVLWTGAAFANSTIQDLNGVIINNPSGVTIQDGGLYVTGASTFHDNVVMQGNLTVNGTASFQNVENLAVKDQFVLLNSGSTTFQDSGIVINTGNAQNSGSAFFLETAGTTTGTDGLYGRFAVAVNVLPDATSATAAEYANTTTITNSAPGATVPQFGGTQLGQGNMWVDTTSSDIWIYA
jgi:hypothetical protein